MIGNHATLQFQHGGSGDLALGTTKAACEALTKAAVIGDRQGFMQIIMSGRGFGVPPGIKVLVLDRTIGLCEVRLLEGRFQGRSGWLEVEFVNPD